MVTAMVKVMVMVTDVDMVKATITVALHLPFTLHLLAHLWSCLRIRARDWGVEKGLD